MSQPRGKKRAWKAQTPSCVLFLPSPHKGTWPARKVGQATYIGLFSNNNRAHRQGGEGISALYMAPAHPMPSGLCWWDL